ncbi:37S ribosomal protein S22 [Rhodotorula kratochvilovae]
MLPRSVRAAAPAGRRKASSAAIDRLSLDIFAAHNAEQERASGPGATTKSAAARRGESLRGDVQLPRELQLATNAIVEGIEDKTILRNHALDLYARLQRTSGHPSAAQTQKDRQNNSLSYDAPTSLAYLAGLMPQVYAATLHVLDITKQRMILLSTREGAETWEPERLVDYGSGTGSAAWAFEDVWGVETPARTAREYVGLDPSRSMVELSSGLFGALPLRLTDDGASSGAAASARLDAKTHQLALPASVTSLAKLHLSPKSGEKKRTLALAAFSLGELATREKRKDVVRAMWDSGAEVMIIIDRGTPAGSRIVVEAREQLLMFGRREVMRAKGVVEVEVDQDLLDAGLEIVPEVAEDVEVDPSLGSFVVAPCPHDAGCPLHRSTKAFCHFSQRVKTPAFLRHTKHSTRGEEDAKFSYVVIRRGQRPVSPARASAFSDLLASVEVSGIPAEAEAATSVVISTSAEDVEAAIDVPSELAWPRLVAAPKKRSGHVIMEVCASSGEIERHTIPKSQGRQAYYDARKASWGDSFPHAPKNGPQPSPATAPSPHDSAADAAVPRNKFGGDPKQRGTKAERELGKRAARALREEGRRERSAKRAGKKGGAGEGTFGGFANANGVVDVELDFGPDGQLRARR